MATILTVSHKKFLSVGPQFKENFGFFFKTVLVKFAIV